MLRISKQQKLVLVVTLAAGYKSSDVKLLNDRRIVLYVRVGIKDEKTKLVTDLRSGASIQMTGRDFIFPVYVGDVFAYPDGHKYMITQEVVYGGAEVVALSDKERNFRFLPSTLGEIRVQ